MIVEFSQVAMMRCLRAISHCKDEAASEIRFSSYADIPTLVFDLEELRKQTALENGFRLCNAIDRLQENDGSVYVVPRDQQVIMPDTIRSAEPRLDLHELIITPYSIRFSVVPKHAECEVYTAELSLADFTERVLPKTRKVLVRAQRVNRVEWCRVIRVPFDWTEDQCEQVVKNRVRVVVPRQEFSDDCGWEWFDGEHYMEEVEPGDPALDKLPVRYTLTRGGVVLDGDREDES